MASSNRGIWLLLALGLAGGVGFAIYYFLILIPGSERAEAREQVQEWADKRWRPLRSCLVGATPRAAGGADALLLRAALTTSSLPGPRECTRFFVDLRRPGTVSSGDADIERAWKALVAETARLATAYVGIDFDRVGTLARVGAGIDAVDRAYAALRDEAGLSPEPPPGPASFPLAPPGVVQPGTEDVLVGRVLVAGQAILGHATRADDVPVWLTVRGPDDLRLEGVPRGDVRVAADDDRWGMWRETGRKGDAKLLAGPLDAANLPAGAGTVLVQTKADAGLAAPVFAFGRGPVRVVAYELAVDAAPALWVARSLDGGATFPERIEVRGDDAGIGFRPSLGQRRFDAFWRDGTGILWLGLGADDAAAPLQPRPAFPAPDADPETAHSCHGGAAEWMVMRGAIARAPAGGPVTSVGAVDIGNQMLACDAEHLVMRLPERYEIAVCEPTGCKPGLRARSGPGSTLAASWGQRTGLIAATTAGDLLVVWRNGAPTILRLPSGQRTLHAVVEWNGAVHLLFEIIERGLEIVRLP